jgi:hypothetical protein
MHDLNPLVTHMLTTHAEFLSVGSAMSPSGEITRVSAFPMDGPATEATVVASIEGRLRLGAGEGRYMATAYVVHLRVVPPGKSTVQQAIGYRWDHRDRYSRVLVFPCHYRPDGKFELENSFSMRGEDRIFRDGGQLVFPHLGSNDDTLPELERMSCDLESKLHSTAGDVPAVVRFVNQRGEDVQLLWLDYDGQRKSYGSIRAGATLDKETFLTHPWVIASPEGLCIEIRVPGVSRSRATLRP